MSGACARESTLLPATYTSAGDCDEGASCLSGLCLPADGDFDGDGVTNAVEASLGSDLLRADSDGDGFPDGFELSDGEAPDLDGDGRPNVVERSDGDADRDCIPD